MKKKFEPLTERVVMTSGTCSAVTVYESNEGHWYKVEITTTVVATGWFNERSTVEEVDSTPPITVVEFSIGDVLMVTVSAPVTKLYDKLVELKTMFWPPGAVLSPVRYRVSEDMIKLPYFDELPSYRE